MSATRRPRDRSSRRRLGDDLDSGVPGKQFVPFEIRLLVRRREIDLRVQLFRTAQGDMLALLRVIDLKMLEIYG